MNMKYAFSLFLSLLFISPLMQGMEQVYVNYEKLDFGRHEDTWLKNLRNKQEEDKKEGKEFNKEAYLQDLQRMAPDKKMLPPKDTLLDDSSIEARRNFIFKLKEGVDHEFSMKIGRCGKCSEEEIQSFNTHMKDIITYHCKDSVGRLLLRDILYNYNGACARDVIELLVGTNIDQNKLVKGQTALIQLCSHSDVAMVMCWCCSSENCQEVRRLPLAELLVKFGADPRIQGQDSYHKAGAPLKNAREMARKNGFPVLAKYLAEVAAQKNREELIKIEQK